MRRWLWLSAALLPLAPLAGQEGEAGSVPLVVTETAGLRRFGYPVAVEVPLPRGAVRGPASLLLETSAGPLRGVQYDVAARWPDESVRVVRLSFNLSPGPAERTPLTLRWGPGVSHPDPGATVVQEGPDAVTLRGVYRLARSQPGAIESIRYGGREFLRAPTAWSVERVQGDVSTPLELVPGSVRLGVLAPGPVDARVEWTGSFREEGGTLPFRLLLSQPNSKSWFDALLTVEDPRRVVRRLVFGAPYTVERAPAMYDFGVGSWVYGALRAGQSARLEVGARPAWRILTFPSGTGEPAVYASATASQPRSEGWGHLAETTVGGRVVAFGSPELAQGRLSGSLRVAATGQVTLTWRVPPRHRHAVRALFHHVNNPAQVSAATSPAAMLQPLRVILPEGWPARTAGGEPIPDAAGAR